VEVKPVGLLWDSVSNNTGDIAIGMVLKRFCETRAVPFQVVDPFAYLPSAYSTFIIGGGQLLRDRENVFNRSFRVPGPHILNTVGIHRPDHLEYLREYRLVTVRSQAEKDQVLQLCPDLKVEVRPCITTRFDEFFRAEIEQAREEMPQKGEWIGVHLNCTTLGRMPDLFAALEALNRQNRIRFIPFTHYENDRFLMETLSKWLPGSEVSPAADPVSIYAEIGGLQALVASSMHAAMFAYLQNVPVLAFPQDFKIRYFFEERGFPGSLYSSAADMPAKLQGMLQAPPDYAPSADRDRAAVESHLEQVKEIVLDPVDYRYADETEFLDSRFHELRRTFFCFAAQKHFEMNSQATRILDLQIQIKRSEPLEVAENMEGRGGPGQPAPSRTGRLFTALDRIFHHRKYARFLSVLRSSDLFNNSWYLQHNPDVRAAVMDPAEHYLYYGGFEGRDPGPGFSSAGYLAAYPDVKKARVNPLVHYLLYGMQEGRLPMGWKG